MPNNFFKFGFFIFTITLLISSCEKQEISITESSELVGFWIKPQYTDSIVTFSKSDKLIDNEYGIAFNSKGNILERKNAGWCGTPPVTYDDFEGTWEIRNSTIIIHVAYWGGMADYSWKLVSVNNNELKVVQIESFYYPIDLKR